MKRLFGGKKLGFTGTREGLNEAQTSWLRAFLFENPPDQAGHGACMGADIDFHNLVREVVPSCKIIAWPSTSNATRRECDADVVHDLMAPKKRDQLIVNFANYFVGCPHTDYEITQSGTWMTLRMARRKLEKGGLDSLHVCYPTAGIVEGDWRCFEGVRP